MHGIFQIDQHAIVGGHSIDTRIKQYSSTEYRDHEVLRFLAPKYYPKPTQHLLFVTSREDWLGIAKSKNVLDKS